ncbi:MAG: response regulator [Lachnospiraceae bacterium]|nr:response regulator [Lachnospiraceae bacterium]
MTDRRATDVLVPVLARMYEQIFLLDKNTGGGMIIREGNISETDDYNKWCAQMYQECYEGDDRVLFLQKISAETVTASLTYEDEYVVEFSVKEEDRIYRKQMKAFLYEEENVVCICIHDVTQQYAREQTRERIAKICLETAQKTNIEKELFFQNVSDTFCLPVFQATELLKEALEREGTEAVKYVQKAKTILDSYSKSCEKMFTLSALEKGEEFDRDDMIFCSDLAEEIEQVVLLEKDGICCEVLLGDAAVKVSGFLSDKSRLRQVLSNAASAMTCASSDCSSVVNLDIDMKKESEMQEEVFDLLFKVTARGVTDAVMKDARMLFAQRLTDYMDGIVKLTVNSEGAECFVRIPVQRADKERQKEARKAARMSDSIISRDFAGFRALVIDDDEVGREITAAKLQQYGLTVETAEDGQEALNMLLASPGRYYQIIFTKMYLPKKSGLELTMELREETRRDLNDITIVALTANPLKDTRIRALEHGMDHHLILPFNEIELKEILLRELTDLGPEDLPEKFGFRVLK